ncbi:uncharacterized protein PSANT_02266 [Moesziomyces antarcticus]|nr:uncharacterized protein PSANT_02266 [Moesziomyces antarcticus]
MKGPDSEPGPSSAPKLSLLPSNVLTVFLARFHVRHGNQIEYQYPPAPKQSRTDEVLVDVTDGTAQKGDADDEISGVDLSGVEWKVLPSGGHLINEDVIYFQTSRPGSIGVACFRKVDLDNEDADAAAQRGARMVSAGLILQCEGPTDQHPSGLAQQLAIVPHVSNLKKLAEELAHDSEDVRPLRSYYDTHRARSAAADVTLDGKRMKQLRMRRRRDPRNLPHDPISHMPALCGSLGALLPHLLKKLMLPRHRLLIFSPAPPIVNAAHLGYNLADLVALAVGRSGRRHENLLALAQRGIIDVRGQIGVHDIPELEQEQQQRAKSHDMLPQRSWIAWSTDKILLEKPHLFDSVLDLTPLITRDSRGVLDEALMEASSTGARLFTVVRPPATESRKRGGGAQLKAESWTTREFATFNELDAQAQRNAERAERLGAAACISRRRSRNKLLRSSSYRSEEAQERSSRDIEYTHAQADSVSQWRGGCSPRRSGAGTLSAALAFLRYWLTGWWFLPRHWRYGLPAAYVLPLGIRGDGGVRASILVMPEDESDDEDLDDEEDREIAAEDEAEEERRSALEAEPVGGAEDAGEHVAARWRVAAVMAEDQQTGTNSSSDTEELELHRGHAHHLIPPDPLLAAVGASPVRGPGVAESDRLSMSHASLRRRSTDRSAYARSVGGSEGQHELGAWYSDEQDRFHSILSDSLWMVWSHWTAALVSGLLDILEDRLAQIEQEDDASLSEEADVSALLISRVAEGLEMSLGPADMASLGLSAGNQLDVQLVESLGSTCLQLLTSSICDGVCQPRVKVDRGWSLFRWIL